MVEETEEKQGGKKKLAMIVVPVVLLVAGAGFFLMGGSDDATAEVPEPAEVEVAEGEVIDIGKMTVSLSGLGENGQLRYARVGLAVVLSETADSALVGTRISLIQDAAISVIAEMSADELRTGDGMNALRQELTTEAHEIYPDGDVVRVVLTELIVQ